MSTKDYKGTEKNVNVCDNWEDEEEKVIRETYQHAVDAQKGQRFSQTSAKKKSGKKKLREEEKKEQMAERMCHVHVSYEEKKAGLEKSKASDFENAKSLFSGLDLGSDLENEEDFDE